MKKYIISAAFSLSGLFSDNLFDAKGRIDMYGGISIVECIHSHNRATSVYGSFSIFIPSTSQLCSYLSIAGFIAKDKECKDGILRDREAVVKGSTTIGLDTEPNLGLNQKGFISIAGIGLVSRFGLRERIPIPPSEITCQYEEPQYEEIIQSYSTASILVSAIGIFEEFSTNRKNARTDFGGGKNLWEMTSVKDLGLGMLMQITFKSLKNKLLLYPQIGLYSQIASSSYIYGSGDDANVINKIEVDRVLGIPILYTALPVRFLLLGNLSASAKVEFLSSIRSYSDKNIALLNSLRDSYVESIYMTSISFGITYMFD